MDEYLDIKVTVINGVFHVRLTNTDTNAIVNEMRCVERLDVSYCIREMLRMHDKLGGTSPMAAASRGRNKNISPIGKIERIQLSGR
jgi:hypothetical protein